MKTPLRSLMRKIPWFKPRSICFIKLGAKGRNISLQQLGYTKGDEIVLLPKKDFELLKRAAKQRTDKLSIFRTLVATMYCLNLEEMEERFKL